MRACFFVWFLFCFVLLACLFVVCSGGGLSVLVKDFNPNIYISASDGSFQLFSS